MMKGYQQAMICMALTFSASVVAEEEKVERAWSVDYGPMIAGPYVYASMAVPINTIPKLSQIDIPEDDPFSNTAPERGTAIQRALEKIAPSLPGNTLPQCLPIGVQFRNLSELLARSGVALKGKEWALQGVDRNGDARVYFCTSLQNAGIIEQIFTPMYRGAPRSINQLATLVSVPKQPLNNKAWTMENLKKLTPTIHSRYGIHGRSGEKCSIQFAHNNIPLSNYEIEPTLGENSLTLDCRIAFSNKFPNSKIKLAQETAITNSIGQPFILDFGMRGEPLRNYLLILESEKIHVDAYPRLSPIISLKSIEGIYAFPEKPVELKNAPNELETHCYRAVSRFLAELREIVENRNFKMEIDPKMPQPPARVKGLKDNKFHSSTDAVYNITPQVQYLGMRLFRGEWVYFNRTKNQLIVHGIPNLHASIIRFADNICPAFHMMTIQVEIVEVDRAGLKMADWKTPDILAANPKWLAKYSSTVRSGEKAIYGNVNFKEPAADSAKDETKNPHTPEVLVEPTLTENKQWIDLRYSLRSNPLGDEKLMISIDTAATIKNGIPRTIEIGHPNSSTRTQLLVLTGNVITADGSFYRDRFKPIEE